MRIYLDNNATTEIHPEVLAAFQRELAVCFGNPSSIHRDGQRARRVLEEARASVASLIGAEARDIVFTSGGTESNNAAIFGKILSSGTRCHIVTTAIEHPSVLEPIQELERRGHAVTRVAPGRDGVVEPGSIEEAMQPDTALVAFMLANNETGALQDVRGVAALCRPRGIHLHVDAVQACGKIDVAVEELGVDSLSLAAHKMHGPKGIGALYVRSGAELTPLLLGGAQERRRRAGTENAPLAAGFAVAASLVAPEEMERVRRLRDRLEEGLLERVPGGFMNAGAAARLPNTSSICFRGHDGEGMVIAMDLAGVSLSTGSACASGRIEPSHVLLAMGLSEQDARSSVRISLSRFTTSEETDAALDKMREVLPRTATVSLSRSR